MFDKYLYVGLGYVKKFDLVYWMLSSYKVVWDLDL